MKQLMCIKQGTMVIYYAGEGYWYVCKVKEVTNTSLLLLRDIHSTHVSQMAYECMGNPHPDKYTPHSFYACPEELAYYTVFRDEPVYEIKV